MNYDVGVQLTTRCNYRCDHCMFSCTRKGEDMSYDTMQWIKAFIRDNPGIGTMNVYGGEPFMDIKLFDLYKNTLYSDNYSTFISSNGTFLLSKEKRRYVFDFLRHTNATNISGMDAPVSVRISASDFHMKFWSDRMKRLIREVKDISDGDIPWNESIFCDEYEEDGVWYEDYESGIIIPSRWGSITAMYVDYQGGASRMNPSGRALKNGCYNGSHKMYCWITSYAEVCDEDWVQEKLSDHPINIYPNGDVAICCSCKSGTIGNIRDIHTMDDMIERIIAFRDQLRDKYPNICEDSNSDYVCPKCVREKLDPTLITPLSEREKYATEL